MNCEACREHLPDVAEGGGSSEVRRHVDSCGACQAQVRLFRETWRLLLASPSAKPSVGFLRAVKEKAHGRANRILRIFAPLTAAAAAAILLVVVSLSGPSSAPIDPVASVETELRGLPEQDQALFRYLTADDTTWELVENLDDMRAVDLAAPDSFGQDGYLIGEKKP